MNYALLRVANTMIAELEKYGIEPKPESGVIIYRGVVRKLPPYADTPVCKRLLRDYVKDAQRREAEAKKAQEDAQKKRQMGLFDE